MPAARPVGSCRSTSSVVGDLTGCTNLSPHAEKGPTWGPFNQRNPGGVLLSQGESTQVPSALEGLTAVFGMGTGVAPPLRPPEILFVKD
jgi:hypothetical protein